MEKGAELISGRSSVSSIPCLGNRTGFTLTEVVMALAVMSVLLGLGIPKMMSYRSKSMLRGAALQVSGDLAGARMEAIKQNCNVSVSFINATDYQILVDNNGNNSADPGEANLIKNLTDKFQGVYNIKADTRNIFNSRGAMGRMRTITLQNPSGMIHISVSISGRIKVNHLN